MKTVVVVGAGATLAEAIPSHPDRSFTPPLDTTFFTLCRLAELEGRLAVSSYLKQAFGIDPFKGEQRMEEVFNYIYARAFAQGAPEGCLEAYWALLKMYAAAIARTTNKWEANSRYEVGALLKNLWLRDKEGEIVFVTFNQDLVIEKAIEHVGSIQRYAGIPWDLTLCYGMTFTSFLSRSSQSRPFSSGSGSSLSVLKLHGSLNWAYKVRSGADPKNSIRSPNSRLHCLDERNVASDLSLTGPSKTQALIPLIVPPIYEKSSRYGRAVEPVWNLAAEAMSTTDRLILFGYSVPEADFAARALLHGAFHGNSGLDQVEVIDTSSTVAARISEIVHASTLKHYRTVPDFVSDQVAG